MKQERQRKKRAAATDREVTRRLMQAWAMALASHLMDQTPMNRAEALRQAYLVRRVLEGMGRGVVVFTYKKGDGSLRQARGTLCRGVSRAFDEYQYSNGENATHREDTYCYWDLDAEGFRAFKAEKVVEIVKSSDREIVRS